MLDFLTILGIIFLMLIAAIAISIAIIFVSEKISKHFSKEFDVLTFFEDKEKDR